MTSALNDLIKSISINASVGIIVFYVGALLLVFVSLFILNLALKSSDKPNQHQNQLYRVFVVLGVLLFWLLILDHLALYHRYEEYEINNKKIGLTQRLFLIEQDKRNQELIVLEFDAWTIEVSTTMKPTRHSAPREIYREGFLKDKGNTIAIPIGEPQSQLYKNVNALIFETHSQPAKTDKIEVYKNSYLIKSINGVDINDEDGIREFIIKEKDGYSNGIGYDGMTANLDVSTSGLTINPIYVSTDEYFANQNFILRCHKLNTETNEYEYYSYAKLSEKDNFLLPGEPGKYRIFISHKAFVTHQIRDGNVLSNFIECEVENHEIKNLAIVSQYNQVSKIIENINSLKVVNHVAYYDRELTSEEQAIEALKIEMQTNNDNLHKKALSNTNSDIFMSVLNGQVYFNVIVERDNKRTAFPLNLNGYYDKEQTLRKSSLSPDQHAVIFEITNTDTSLLKQIPLNKVEMSELDILWNTLSDGNFVIQIKSTVIDTLCSNKLGIVIQAGKIVKIFDADETSTPVLFDESIAKSTIN